VSAPLLDLAAVEAEARRRADAAGIPHTLLPTFRWGLDSWPHVEIDARGYHYVVYERGREVTRKTTADLDELLFHVFHGAATEIAFRSDAARHAEGDQRRVTFAEREAIMARLSPAWGARVAAEHRAILARHPFRDTVRRPG
jgi:hypothetical protein